MKRTIKDYAVISLKGICMGAADVVPGVSGGTIAFITGIYEEFLNSLKSFNVKNIKLIFTDGVGAFWKSVNGNFLLALFIGIFTSVFSLAKALKWCLDEYPILIWGFFFGLIIASSIVVIKKLSVVNVKVIIALIIGAVASFFITKFTPAETPEAYWFVFLTGALAICAMILPGISGAFILLLLGKYSFILGAISDFNLVIIGVFGLGAVVGLLGFSNILSWLLKKYHDVTIAILAGFMIGSLNKVWPWKETISTRVNSHGEIVPLIQDNISPFNYTNVVGGESYLVYSALLALVGFALIMIFERLTRENK